MATIPLSSYHTFKSYDATVTKLREFFKKRGFLEVEVQSRRSILAACEDPKTVATYTFDGVKWPLPQTGQMWLEYELLTRPEVPGFFCLTTSYRNEPNPIESRHLKIFPLFEFETHGDMNALQTLLEDMFEFLGFGSKDQFRAADYSYLADYYGVKEITHDHEMQVGKDFSHVFMLKKFPYHTSPFFNMKKDGDIALKIDALAYGMETAGCAERSCNADEMYEQFHSISDGQYAQLLYNHFGKERVEKELKDFLSLNFIPRFGGGIGTNRMMRALSLHQKDNPVFMPATKAKVPFTTV